MSKQTTIQHQQEILLQIQQGDERVLNNLYKQYREKFVKWAKWRYNCTEEDAGEVYQKAFVIFYFNIKNGKLASLTARLETYFFGIGKNVFRERFKDKYLKNTTEIDERFDIQDIDMSISDKYERVHQREAVQHLMEQIGEKCRKILTLYYYQKYSMESIARAVGYKNDSVAKKKKYQCLQGLRKMVGDNPAIMKNLLNH